MQKRRFVLQRLMAGNRFTSSEWDQVPRLSIAWFFRSHPHQSCRNACHDRIRRHVRSDHRTSSDLRSLPDTDTGQNDGTHTEIGIAFDHHGCKLNTAMEYRFGNTFLCVKGRDDFYSGSDPHVAPDAQIAGTMKEALLTDPGPVSDHHPAAIVPFQDGAVAHIDSVSQLHGFGVKNQHPRFDDYVLADACELGSFEPARTVAASHGPQNSRILNHRIQELPLPFVENFLQFLGYRFLFVTSHVRIQGKGQ
jgi:hypothetical protein